MKILWVKSDFLHPTVGGGQIRTLEMLKRLHNRHEIHFAALDLPESGAGLKQSSEYSRRAYPVPHRLPPKSGPHYWLDLARGACSPMPLSMLRYRSPALLAEVEFLTRHQRFDAIVCDFLASAANISELDRAILFQHNVESIIWRRHVEHAHTSLHRIYARSQYKRMVAYERGVCRAAKKIVAVSQSDARAMRAMYDAPRVDSIPTGVDIGYFTPETATAHQYDLVFVGAMDWRPNIDGLKWFVAESLPLIRAQRPGCSLAIVGRNPGAEIQRLAETDQRIVVTGTVDDVRPYVWRSAISIVPLRIGGGTRLKIYEAMASKTAVVSTSIGAEGLDVRDGENIRLADSPVEFAARCLELVNDPAGRSRIERNAWEMVAACYSWEVVSRKFEKLLE
jgi:polysaccharide biosynthesis protein PslH